MMEWLTSKVLSRDQGLYCIMLMDKNKMDRWLPHLFGLSLFIILPILVFDSSNDRSIFWIFNYYYQLVFMLVAFYTNFLVLVPHLFFSKRTFYFVSLFLFTILLLMVMNNLDGWLSLNQVRPDAQVQPTDIRPKSMFGLHPRIIDNFFQLIVVLGFSSGMAIVQQLRMRERKQKAIEKARVDSELAFLKNQISPHFFFNSLNNIYALIEIDGKKAQKALEELSTLMRYLIYESNIEMIELNKDIEFTQNYIALMRQRLSAKVDLDVNIDKNIPDVKIPPLLFIPFIENAFKHGVSYREKSFIHINLACESKHIVLRCSNSIALRSEDGQQKGGVGIENIKKRLELLYGKSHDLSMDSLKKEYKVELKLPLEHRAHE